MAAGGIDGCFYWRSKERSDLSDSLLPCHPSCGAGYNGIRPAERVRDWRRTPAERCAESGCSLTLVPLQNNSNFDSGPFNRTQNVFNIQPVIPVNISSYWKVIGRIVQPLVWLPSPNQNTGGEYGLGDMAPDFFFAPRHPGKLMWGIGPAFAIPTATDHVLGQGKFSMGPSAVVLVQPGKWTIVNLVNNVWSVAGSGSRPSVNQMLDQYFITRNLKKGWYVTSAPIITANWNAPSGNVWTVPFGGGPGRVQKLGTQPVNWKVEFFANAVHPKGGPSWSMRLTLAFLYPKNSRE